MMTELRGYAKSISEATGVTDPGDLADIEDSMRHEIFHSTLDWQTKAQFNRGAREAWEIVQMLRDPSVLAALTAQVEAEYAASLRAQ
jgi:hypothetical protein